MSGHTIGARIDGLLGMLWDARGTDLLLTAGMPPQARVHGDLHAVPNTPVLTADDTNSLLAELLTVTQTKAGMQRVSTTSHSAGGATLASAATPSPSAGPRPSHCG